MCSHLLPLRTPPSQEHYDAGNDMYRLFLDPSMMYSSAIHSPGVSLYDAQVREVHAWTSVRVGYTESWVMLR